MCVFPNIYYVDNFVPLQNGPENELPPSVRGMFTVLLNQGVVDEHFLDGIHTMNGLEAQIFNLIDRYPMNGVSSERIFHLIEIWGGRTGRRFYCDQPFNWQDIEPIYNGLLNDFLAIDHIDDHILEQAASAVNTFYNAIHEVGYKGMAVAFITKHSRFWMHKNLPNSMLPIYDSTFSDNVMQKGTTAHYRHLLPFWRGMVAKAEQEHVSLTSLERQLFNYYRIIQL